MSDEPKVADLRDHRSRAYQVSATVFLERTRNTSVRLARGEHLFMLTDDGVKEAGYCGPDNVMVMTERFGCWPVVAVKVRAAHLHAWRTLPAGVHEAMMRRVRTKLEATPA